MIVQLRNRVLILFCFLNGCLSWPIKNSDSQGGRPIVAHAVLLDQCPGAKQQEPELGGAVALLLVGKSIDILVDYVAKNVEAAAKVDNEPYVLVADDPDFLYFKAPVQEKDKADNAPTEYDWFPKSCLVIVAGEQFSEGDPGLTNDGKKMDPNDKQPWYMQQTMEDFASNHSTIGQYFRKWGFREPKLYVEVWFTPLNDGPKEYYVPEIMRLYYPAAIRDNSKDASLVLSISIKDARGATNSNNLMSTIFSIGKPRTPDLPGEHAYATGHWSRFPALASNDPVGNKFAGPVQVEASVTESKNPNIFLQELAKLVESQKESVKEALKDELIASRKEAIAQQNDDKKLTEKITTIQVCSTLAQNKLALVSARNQSVDPTNGYKTQELKDAAVEIAKLQVIQAETSAKRAWKASGFNGSPCEGIGQ